MSSHWQMTRAVASCDAGARRSHPPSARLRCVALFHSSSPSPPSFPSGTRRLATWTPRALWTRPCSLAPTRRYFRGLPPQDSILPPRALNEGRINRICGARPRAGFRNKVPLLGCGMCMETVAESPPLCVVKCYTRIFLASRHLSNKQRG
jgi:hypothetical protein